MPYVIRNGALAWEPDKPAAVVAEPSHEDPGTTAAVPRETPAKPAKTTKAAKKK